MANTAMNFGLNFNHPANELWYNGMSRESVISRQKQEKYFHRLNIELKWITRKIKKNRKIYRKTFSQTVKREIIEDELEWIKLSSAFWDLKTRLRYY